MEDDGEPRAAPSLPRFPTLIRDADGAPDGAAAADAPAAPGVRLAPPPKFPSMMDVGLPNAESVAAASAAAAAAEEPMSAPPPPAHSSLLDSAEIEETLRVSAVPLGTGERRAREAERAVWGPDDQTQFDDLLKGGDPLQMSAPYASEGSGAAPLAADASWIGKSAPAITRIDSGVAVEDSDDADEPAGTAPRYVDDEAEAAVNKFPVLPPAAGAGADAVDAEDGDMSPVGKGYAPSKAAELADEALRKESLRTSVVAPAAPVVTDSALASGDSSWIGGKLYLSKNDGDEDVEEGEDRPDALLAARDALQPASKLDKDDDADQDGDDLAWGSNLRKRVDSDDDNDEDVVEGEEIVSGDVDILEDEEVVDDGGTDVVTGTSSMFAGEEVMHDARGEAMPVGDDDEDGKRSGAAAAAAVGAPGAVAALLASQTSGSAAREVLPDDDEDDGVPEWAKKTLAPAGAGAAALGAAAVASKADDGTPKREMLASADEDTRVPEWVSSQKGKQRDFTTSEASKALEEKDDVPEWVRNRPKLTPAGTLEHGTSDDVAGPGTVDSDLAAEAAQSRDAAFSGPGGDAFGTGGVAYGEPELDGVKDLPYETQEETTSSRDVPDGILHTDSSVVFDDDAVDSDTLAAAADAGMPPRDSSLKQTDDDALVESAAGADGLYDTATDPSEPLPYSSLTGLPRTSSASNADLEQPPRYSSLTSDSYTPVPVTGAASMLDETPEAIAEEAEDSLPRAVSGGDTAPGYKAIAPIVVPESELEMPPPTTDLAAGDVTAKEDKDDSDKGGHAAGLLGAGVVGGALGAAGASVLGAGDAAKNGAGGAARDLAGSDLQSGPASNAVSETLPSSLDHGFEESTDLDKPLAAASGAAGVFAMGNGVADPARESSQATDDFLSTSAPFAELPQRAADAPSDAPSFASDAVHPSASGADLPDLPSVPSMSPIQPRSVAESDDGTGDQVEREPAVVPEKDTLPSVPVVAGSTTGGSVEKNGGAQYARMDSAASGQEVRGLSNSTSASLHTAVSRPDPGVNGTHVNITGDFGLIGGHEVGVNDAAFIDGSTLLTAGRDGKVCVWDLENEVVKCEFIPFKGKPVSLLHVLPNEDDSPGRTIMTMSEDRLMRIWNFTDDCAVLLRSMQIPSAKGDLVMSLPIITPELRQKAAVSAAAVAASKKAEEEAITGEDAGPTEESEEDEEETTGKKSPGLFGGGLFGRRKQAVPA